MPPIHTIPSHVFVDSARSLSWRTGLLLWEQLKHSDITNASFLLGRQLSKVYGRKRRRKAICRSGHWVAGLIAFPECGPPLFGFS